MEQDGKQSDSEVEINSNHKHCPDMIVFLKKEMPEAVFHLLI